MRLNYPRTMLVGLAFFSICAFWQLYDATVPLMLRDTFHMRDTLAGVVMALDNALALFMLPLFGFLSDHTNSKYGRRMPYILFGTVLAAILSGLLGFMDSRAQLIPFLLVLFVLLLAMGTYRSPAVALMPDVTPKPLRSRANAIINLMGALGGIVSLILISTCITETADGRTDYRLAYVMLAVVMLVSVALLKLTVNEGNLSLPPDPKEPKVKDGTKLTREVFISLVAILLSVFFWFMGYNAVTTAFTKYATLEWNMPLSMASTCLMLATGAAILSYLPVGILSSRIGRKKMIIFGALLLTICFGVGFFIRGAGPVTYVLFAMIGFAWAAINVNSYPMVVELATGNSVGRYTGYYYTFSMAAQIITPVASGFLLEHVGYWTLFLYAALMVLISVGTMTFAKHGDSTPDAPESTLEAFDAPD